MFSILQQILNSIFGGAPKQPAATQGQTSAGVYNQPPMPTNLQNAQAMPKTGKLTQRQVELLAQKVVSTHFPNVDWRMIVTMAAIESDFNPSAFRYEPHIKDASYGLMQVLTKTAEWIYKDLGRRVYGVPNEVRLRDPETSIYFGAAYVDWLRRWKGVARSQEWIVRAYNGGPGFMQTQNGQRMTLNHWKKYQAKRRQLYG